ncbi:MAG TPA: glycosyltransferase family 1 protein [Bryobacteraceae bacterium]|nr:glycosyltransferase family 1 protein [Bryobacteraceae bacterium]
MRGTDIRLCIDAVPLLVRSAGVKNYLYHWISSLRSICGDDHVKLFPFLHELGALDHEHSIANSSLTLARLAFLHLLNQRENHVLDYFPPRTDIFHVSKLLNPPARCRVTATLHDATCWRFPEFHTAANVKAERHFAARILQRAAGVIAVSEHTREDGVNVIGLNPDRIQVIYPGIPEHYFHVDAAQAQDVRQHYDLSRDYILYVGTIEPRKNLARLLDAYEALPTSLLDQYSMVIAGLSGWASEEVVRRIEARPRGVRYLGYVPEASMPGLFAGATVLAYPSIYEGFGFPVAQAMAAGTPVLTSYGSSLSEIAGEAAELVNPLSPAEITAGLERLLTSPSRRTELSAAGRVRAARFRWECCARHSLQFFESVMGRC